MTTCTDGLCGAPDCPRCVPQADTDQLQAEVKRLRIENQRLQNTVSLLQARMKQASRKEKAS